MSVLQKVHAKPKRRIDNGIVPVVFHPASYSGLHHHAVVAQVIRTQLMCRDCQPSMLLAMLLGKYYA